MIHHFVKKPGVIRMGLVSQLVSRLVSKLVIFCVFLPKVVFAITIGGVGENLAGVASGVYILIYKICYIVGTAMLVGSLLRFKEHRDNPQQVPLNQPFTLLLMGFAIVAIPIVSAMSKAIEAVT